MHTGLELQRLAVMDHDPDDQENPELLSHRHKGVRDESSKLTLSHIAIGFLVAAVVVLVSVIMLGLGNKQQESLNQVPEEWKQYFVGVNKAMDRTVDPCEDFYQYACGGWINATTIPQDKSKLEKSFTVLGEQNLNILMQIAQENWPLIGDFYKSCMDIATIDKLGSSVLEQFFSLLSGLTTYSAVVFFIFAH